MWIYSPNGTDTDGPQYQVLPARHWNATSANAGEWVELTEGNAGDYGYYPITEVAQPDRDHVRSVTNTGPGLFTETWTFSQELADRNAIADSEQAAREQANRRYDTFADRGARWLEQPPPADQQDVNSAVAVLQADMGRCMTQIADLMAGSGGVDYDDQDPIPNGGQISSRDYGRN